MYILSFLIYKIIIKTYFVCMLSLLSEFVWHGDWIMITISSSAVLYIFLHQPTHSVYFALCWWRFLGDSSTLFLWCPSIDTHFKSLYSKFQLAMIFVDEICRITWIILLHWILFCNFWCPGIRNIGKMQRSPDFVKTTSILFLQNSYWSEVVNIYRRVLSEYAIKSVCVDKSVLWITGSPNIPLRGKLPLSLSH